MQLEWRVACVRIPRFPIGAVWRAARRGDLGATDVQLLLPFRSEEGGEREEKGRLTNLASAVFSLASGGAPNRSSASETGSPLPPSPSPTSLSPPTSHWDELPIVLTEPGGAGLHASGGRRRLRAVSAAAARAGIRAGMTLAEARALCSELLEYAWNDVALAGATTEMTAMLLTASPQVTPVAGSPGMWWVGASGFASHGRGGERELAFMLRRIAARWHPRPRVAIADSCVAARAATWAGTSFQQGDDRSLVCIVPHRHDAAYLASAPLALIPMADELRAALQALGLRTVGAFAALSPDDVEQRWGNDGLQAWRLARGEDRRRPVLARVPEHPVVEAELPAPSATMEPVLFLVRAALDRLTNQLAAKGRAVAAFAITLTLDDVRGALPVDALARPHTVTREVRLARPVARTAPLFERSRALLDTWTLTAPTIGVTVAIVATAPLSGEQGDLLDASWRDPAAVEAALARLRAELGPNVVVKPVARDSHAPERMGTWKEQELEGAAAEERKLIKKRELMEERGLIKERELHKSANGTRAQTAEERKLQKSATATSATAKGATATAIRLLESPESVFVACDNGAPASVVWRGRRITVERAMGPERLSGDWWDDGYRRDYWRCESAFGDFVLYLDRMDDQWWVQGWYD